MDHNNFNASSSTKTEEIIKEQAATQEKSCCSNDNATPSAPACCCTRHTDRSEADRKKLINRLKRIEGQIRGIIGFHGEVGHRHDGSRILEVEWYLQVH